MLPYDDKVFMLHSAISRLISGSGMIVIAPLLLFLVIICVSGLILLLQTYMKRRKQRKPAWVNESYNQLEAMLRSKSNSFKSNATPTIIVTRESVSVAGDEVLKSFTSL